MTLTASERSSRCVCRACTARRINLDAARADHIRMILGCGRIVVPLQVAAVRADRVHRRSSEGIWIFTEPGRNDIAGERAAGEVSAGQRPESVCMDGCLM